MAQKKPRGYGYTHIKKTRKKRKGRHAKSVSKRIPGKKRPRGQGKRK